MTKQQPEVTPRTGLAEARLAAGWSQEKLAQRLQVSTGTVRSWEAGTRTPIPQHRQPLAEALGVSPNVVHHMLNGDQPDVGNGHHVPGWLSHYDSLVLAAGRLCEVEFATVPHLLQTRAYASAVERSTEQEVTDGEVSDRVEVRLTRQSVLERDPALQLTVLLGEGVLRDPVGGPHVMAEQLAHLVTMAERPSVDLRLLGPGRGPAAIGGFGLLIRPGDIAPFLAATLDVTGPSYEERAEMVAVFARRFEHLAATATTPEETIRRIDDIRETYR
jgi:transcriptional regulator with XRE-family HTH domain